MKRTAKTDFQLLTENSVDVICRVGLDLVLRYASPSSERIMGWRPEELVGSGPEKTVLAEDLPLIAEAAARLRQTSVFNSPATVRVRRKDGSLIWMEMNARLVRDATTGDAEEVVLVMRDVSERKALEEQLAMMAHTDSLTGLANRRAFDEVLESEWQRTLRDGSAISLLLLDLDNFKQFNDHYGHQAGDDCLRAVAAALRSRMRGTDLAVRYGGEELAAILPLTGCGDAVEIAEQVRLAVARLCIPHSGNSEGAFLVTASIGIATAVACKGGSVRMPETLLVSADGALYKAKAEGRNRIATSLLLTAAKVAA